jgi:uncharacterized protein (TIGR02271 family)
MINESDAGGLIGSTAYDQGGSKLGKIGQVFLDDETGRPEFVTVNTGLFGTKESFVPVAEATMDGDSLRVPYSKDQVKDAPNVDLDGSHLDESEERRLYAHYGISGYAGRSGNDETSGYETSGTTSGKTRGEGYDTSGPTTDDAMTRSEERVRVGTSTQEAGRARLRKYVTTETETHTVPVRKERAVVEREPITDANVDAATEGPDISEEEHEVVLSEERPVVEKVTEPVERVRLGTESTTEDETVTEDVRKEHIETEGDLDSQR